MSSQDNRQRKQAVGIRKLQAKTGRSGDQNRKQQPQFPAGTTYTEADLDNFRSNLHEADQDWFDDLGLKSMLLGKPVPVPDKLDWTHTACFSVDNWKLQMLTDQLWA